MEILASHEAIRRRPREPAVAIGNFDGVHLGHRRLFDEARRLARSRRGDAVALTFAPHPARLLNPALAPPLLTTEARKLELIAGAGMDICVVETFDAQLASLPPEDFVARVLVDGLGARDVCVGADFTFGRERAGRAGDLARLGGQHGFSVEIVPPVGVGGIVCSSTKIREFILEGRVEGAAMLLGRDPEIEGRVVAGLGRGRTLGIPTANLQPETEVLPLAGVYAGWAELLSSGAAAPPGSRWPAAVNIGYSPTFGGSGYRVEAHLLDFTGGSLLEAQLRLGIRRRLRHEERFPTVEALVKQIRSDIEATRAVVAAREDDSPRASLARGGEG